MILLTLGFGLFIKFDEDMPILAVVFIEAVAGLGVGMNFQSPLIALQSLVDQPDYATATATFGFIRNIATSISVIVGGVVFQNGMQFHSTALRRALGEEMAEKFSGANAEANVDIVATLSSDQRRAVRDAYTASLQKMWIMYVCVAGVGLMASLMVGKQTLPSVRPADGNPAPVAQDEGASMTEELQEAPGK